MLKLRCENILIWNVYTVETNQTFFLKNTVSLQKLYASFIIDDAFTVHMIWDQMTYATCTDEPSYMLTFKHSVLL